jgi:hypothetical protein
MRFFYLYILLIPIFSFSQSLKNNLYSDSIRGFSIKFSTEWTVTSKIKAPIFAYNQTKVEIISLNFKPIAPNIKPTFTSEVAEETKSEISNYFRAEGISITQISVFPSLFLDKQCLVIIAVLKDPKYRNGVETYHKTFQFVHHNYLFNIEIMLPYLEFSNEKMAFIERQLKTMKFF